MKWWWRVPIGGTLLLAFSIFGIPAIAHPAPRACQDLDNNGACDGADPDVPAVIGTTDGSFTEAILIENGKTVTCKGAPDWGLKIVAPRITVKGTVTCAFAGGAGVTLRSTGAASTGPNGIRIEGGRITSGGPGVRLDSSTTIDLMNGIAGRPPWSVDNGNALVEATFGGSEVHITSDSHQRYAGADVRSPRLIALTAVGAGTVSTTLDPPNSFTSSYAGTVFVNQPAGSGTGAVDLTGAKVIAGGLIQINSRGDAVGLEGACLQNTEGFSGLHALLTGGGDIFVNSGPGRIIDIEDATLGDGGFGPPKFNGVLTCTPGVDRVVGTPEVCDGGVAYFRVHIFGEEFIVGITDPREIQNALANMRGENHLFPAGTLAVGDGCFNRGHRWHLVPATVKMAQVTIELCQGLPSFVDADFEYWVFTVRQYCAAGAQVVERLR